MAVQKSKKSRARRGNRRAHSALVAPQVSFDALTGEMHRRHHMTATGYYRGKQIVKVKVKDEHHHHDHDHDHHHEH